MLRPKPGFACTLILTALVAACTDPLTEPRGEVARAFTILDAARGGSAGFYFLPPMVPAPGYSGTFDAAQSPVVVICELAGNVCGATVASFDAGEVKVDVVEEAYKVTWKTKGAGLDASKLYRIEVCVGTSVLGFADVMVLNNGNQIRTVDRNEYVASITGGTLNSRFRIETAAPPPPPPPPGWMADGDLVTYAQDDWGTVGTVAGDLLLSEFFNVYPGGVWVGILGAGGFSALWDNPEAVHDFAPSTGDPGPLNNDHQNPLSTSAGGFAGHVLALQIDVDFADAGKLGGTSGMIFGDLRLCDLEPVWPSLPSSSLAVYNEMTVRQFLAEMNTALGGGALLLNPSPAENEWTAVAVLTRAVTGAFERGVPSQFAQDHIVKGPCPQGWQTDEVTYRG